jgi:release factor glutamine methyltransferase
VTAAATGVAAVPPLGRLWRLPGVYRPQADSALLAAALHREVAPGADVLDIGTGSGALAVFAARLGARVDAVDVSWRALLTTRLNAARAGHRVRVRRADLCRPGTGLGSRTYDVVVSNPPYVPAPNSWPGGHSSARAWDAGHDGRRVVDAVCSRAADVLRPQGVLLMVHSGLCGPERTLERLAAHGLTPEVRATARVPFGPVLRSRLPWLRAQGLLEPGEETEELVVIRAERR